MAMDGKGCTCQECEELYKMDLIVDDRLWEMITKHDNANLLCPHCIIERVYSTEDYDYCVYKLEYLP